MGKNIFFKKLMRFLMPSVITLILSNVFIYFIINNILKNEIAMSNISLLNQIKENVEFMISEAESLSINIEANSRINAILKAYLRKPSMLQDSTGIINIFNSFFNTPTYVRPYLHSYYVYYKNLDQNMDQYVLTTPHGKIALKNMADQDWYQSYNNQDNYDNRWVETRYIKKYSFEEKVRVVTIYKKLYSPGVAQAEGVIVVNILPKYFELKFDELLSHKNQCLLVLDDKNSIIFHNSNSYIDNFNIEEICNNSESIFSYYQAGKTYLVTNTYSNLTGWKYISIVPHKSLFKSINTLMSYIIMLIALLIIFGGIFTLIAVKKDYNNIEKIVQLLECADEGKLDYDLDKKIRHEYDYIREIILKNFLEKKYLKVQLSERKFKMIALELMALQAQINPHFLFNTLETIQWDSIKQLNGPNSISRMLNNLSKIVEYILDKPDVKVKLIEEIQYCMFYIEIEKYRYEERLDVTWEFDDKTANNSEVIKLILQPLVENSVQHGLKYKEHCRIKVRIRYKNNCLSIAVIDNGNGFETEKLEKFKDLLETEGYDIAHIGLYNTIKRLMLTYGELFQYKIISSKGRGTAVYFYINQKTKDQVYVC